MTNTTKLAAIALSSFVMLSSCSKAPSQGTSENYNIAEVSANVDKDDVSAELPNESGVTTNNDYVNYTFEYPKSWTIERNDGMISLKSSEEDKNERVTLSCTSYDTYDPQMTVLKYWDGDGTEQNPGYYNQLKETLGGSFTEILRKELKLGNTGSPALKVTYSAKLADKEYRFSHIVSVMEGTVYCFTYTALPEAFETWESALTHAATTFKLK